MKKLFLVFSVSLLALASCTNKYESYEGDPLNTKIYTLDNGLKI